MPCPVSSVLPNHPVESLAATEACLCWQRHGKRPCETQPERARSHRYRSQPLRCRGTAVMQPGSSCVHRRHCGWVAVCVLHSCPHRHREPAPSPPREHPVSLSWSRLQSAPAECRCCCCCWHQPSLAQSAGTRSPQPASFAGEPGAVFASG